MKRLLSILFLLSLSFSAFTFPAKEVLIKGNFNNLGNFMKIYDFENQEYNIDLPAFKIVDMIVDNSRNTYNLCFTEDGKFAFFGTWSQLGPIGYIIDFRQSTIEIEIGIKNEKNFKNNFSNTLNSIHK